ncbi:hypothetical protein Ocin01_01604 [Orchesella cincta]|uniref:F-box domain-containing protein n=1 Tax=Orchesella cincta TaxID=48709 RepID=A0A1D2NIH2_ORCCI|nr:hypothetical protein Ocin01_01604 [Orchesella cincta]
MEACRNPLLNSLIINHVVGFLKFDEKKKCRLICQTWNDEVKKTIRKLSRVKLDARSDNRRLCDLISSLCSPDFCSEFSFSSGNVFTEWQEEIEQVQQFFAKFGPNVKSLSIKNCICSNKDLKAILYEGCPNLESFKYIAMINGRLFQDASITSALASPSASSQAVQIQSQYLLPKLKCLHVNIRSSELVRNTELMIDLLSIAPNLEEISWLKLPHDEVSYDRNFQLDLEKAWSADRQSNGLTIRDTIYDVAIHYKPLKFARLSKIESNMRLSNASILELRDRHFPLQSMNIRLTIDVRDNSLTTLLESLSGTLRSLKIEFYPSLLDATCAVAVYDKSKITHGSFTFPKMEKLQHLFLKTFHGSFNFFPKLKSLKTLSFCELDIRDTVSQLRQDVLHSSVNGLSSSLQLFQVFSDEPHFSNDRELTFTHEDVTVLAKAFPNVSEIRVRGCTKKRRKWLKRFPKLKKMEESASERGIGGLKGPKNDSNECCYCCVHKLQRLAWSFR